MTAPENEAAVLRMEVKRWRRLTLLALAASAFSVWLSWRPRTEIRLKDRHGQAVLTPTSLVFFDDKGRRFVEVVGNRESTSWKHTVMVHGSGDSSVALTVAGHEDGKRYPKIEMHGPLGVKQFGVTAYTWETKMTLAAEKPVQPPYDPEEKPTETTLETIVHPDHVETIETLYAGGKTTIKP